jgi:hypothetical protein
MTFWSLVRRSLPSGLVSWHFPSADNLRQISSRLPFLALRRWESTITHWTADSQPQTYPLKCSERFKLPSEADIATALNDVCFRG